MTTETTTPTDLGELWRQHEALTARFDEPDYDSDEEHDRLGSEQFAIYNQIAAADPTDLPGILIQLRALHDDLHIGSRAGQDEYLAAIVGRLKRLAEAA
jgi:hypothetical protein